MVLTFGKLFLTRVALKIHQAYLKNPQDIWDLFIKGLPFTKNNLPITKKILPFIKNILPFPKNILPNGD